MEQVTASEEGHYKIFYHQNAKIGRHGSRADFHRAVLDSFSSFHDAEELFVENRRGQTGSNISADCGCKILSAPGWSIGLDPTTTQDTDCLADRERVAENDEHVMNILNDWAIHFVGPIMGPRTMQSGPEHNDVMTDDNWLCLRHLYSMSSHIRMHGPIL